MLAQVIAFSIRNKLIVGLLTVALIGAGIWQLLLLPIDAVPDITDNQVQVITVTPSLGAPDVERLITYPIEQANSNIPGLQKIRSFSRFGLSLVTIVFDEHVDVYWARQQVSERLQMVKSQIPAGVGEPELAPLTTGLGEIYQYVLRPAPGFEKKYGPMELRTIQDWIIRRQLLGVRGVADVSSFGGKVKQYEIAIDPGQLSAYGLSIDDVFQALERNNQNAGGAYIEKGPSVLFIRTEGLVGSEEDIRNILVENRGQSTILIRDVAEVRLGYANRYGAVCYNDQGEVAGAVVMMLKGENSSAVIKRVKSKMDEIRRTLPEGVIVEAFLDRTKMVNHAIGTVEKNLVEGALIVIFILVLFLGNFRAGLVTASLIPLSMLFAVIMMNMFGVSGNLMSLGAIDFGLIVDGAVIIVEAVMHRLYHSSFWGAGYRFTRDEMDVEVKNSASRMMSAAVFGQVIIIIVYLPIFTLQGIEGKMFKPMAQTVAFALLGAFLLSITYVPMITSLVLKRTVSGKHTFSDRMMEFLENIFQRGLNIVLRFRKSVISAAVVLFIFAAFILSTMGGEFIPELEEGDFAVDTRVLTGSNLQTTIDVTQKAAGRLLQDFPEIEKVVTKIGSGEIPTDPMPIEASDLMIILKDKSEWKSAETFDELAEKMSARLEEIPGMTFGFQFPVQMRFNELMTGARQDVVCKIFGEDLDTLRHLADRLSVIVGTVEGATDLYLERVSGMPQIVIRYDRPALSRYGVDVQTVNRAVETAFAGTASGWVFEGEKRFDLVVRMEKGLRTGLEDVRSLLVETQSGIPVPLDQLADVDLVEGPAQVQREDTRRRIMVGFNVRGRDVKSTVHDLEEKVKKGMKFPPGYYVKYGGTFENLEQATERLSYAVPVSLILIFVMLYFALGSIRQGLLIYSAIPLSTIGGILALYTRGMPFSISAGVGFIALFGVAVLNGIVLISEFNHLREEGEVDPVAIVLKGTRLRLRPVLMTAAVASLGFLPMAISHGAGAEVQRPLATVVIGGLVTATFLTLFVLPVLYVLFGEKKKKEKTHMGAQNAVQVLLILALCGGGTVWSQQPVTLDQAQDLAYQNNLSLKSARMKWGASVQAAQTAVDVPPLEIQLEYGNVNSMARDNRFLFSQSFDFPTVYIQRKKALDYAQGQASYEVENLALETRARVYALFQRYLLLAEKQRILKQADSVWAEVLRREDLKLEKGQSDMVDQKTASLGRNQFRQGLLAVEQDMRETLARFNFELNAEGQRIPAQSPFRVAELLSIDSASMSRNPALLALEHQANSHRAMEKSERSTLLPQLTVGYSSMTIIGFQNITGTDLYFGPGRRFGTVMGGVSVPLVWRAKNFRARTENALAMLAVYEKEKTAKELENELAIAIAGYRNAGEILAVYETRLLPDADALADAADRKLAAGEISFTDWSWLAGQVWNVKLGWLDAVDSWNEYNIQIRKLTLWISK